MRGNTAELRSEWLAFFACWRSTEAAALAEFAVALPLLIVLVVGIYDFGGAFNTKQELNNALREGARFGAAQPTNDLCVSCASPPSVDAIRLVVASYLQTAKAGGTPPYDCGLSALPAGSGNGFGSPLVWTYTASAFPCTAALPLQLKIYRGAPSCQGCPLQETLPNVPTQVNLLSTQIQISYPYQWLFAGALRGLAGLNLPLTITTQATAANMD